MADKTINLFLIDALMQWNVFPILNEITRFQPLYLDNRANVNNASVNYDLCRLTSK